MSEIVRRSAEIMNVKVEKDAINEISRRARKTPRIANRILKRARDLVEVDHLKVIDHDVVDRLFTLLEIDEEGLSDIDIQYMKVIAERFQNSPVGVETIASALSEDRQTVEDFIEPYLLQLGYIKKTPRGRVITSLAAKHLGIKVASTDVEQQQLV